MKQWFDDEISKQSLFYFLLVGKVNQITFETLQMPITKQKEDLYMLGLKDERKASMTYIWDQDMLQGCA